MALNLVMIGPPGAGKGTQAIRVCRQYGIPKVSTGDILREAVHAGSALGGDVKDIIGAGRLVSDEVIIAVVRERLAKDDTARFHELLGPTVPLSRHIFQAPTRFYKTGVVFMAWLNGLQDHFVMVGGQQSARSLQHLSELFRYADQAGLLRDPALACARMRNSLNRRRSRGVH